MSPTSADRTLRDLLRSETGFSFERAAEILADLAAALVPLHVAGRAHAAITPQSIHIDPDGHARVGPPGGDRIAMGLFPPAYLAPELIDGEPATPRSDVYTLGLLGWEMLVGRTPWEGESVIEVVEHQRADDLPRLTTLRPGVPRPLLLAIEGAIHKSPGDRWATAKEMLAVLRPEEASVPLASVVPPAAVAEPEEPEPVAAAESAVPAWEPATVVNVATTRPRRGHGKQIALVALVLAVLIAGGAALASFQGRTKQHATGPWIDSITTSTSAGVVVTDDTTSTAARMRIQRIRDSLAQAAALAAAPPPVYMPPPAPLPPAYDTTTRTHVTAPAAALPVAPLPAAPPAMLDPETRAAQARARADSARRARATADSARRAAEETTPVDTGVSTPPRPAPAVDSDRAKPAPDSVRPKPTADSARPKPATTDSAAKPKPKPDSTKAKPDTIP
jgi:serine/threonine-protein kinase